MSSFAVKLAYERKGRIQAHNPDEGIYCDKCLAGGVHVLSFDTSEGEYGCVGVCRFCIKNLFDALASKKPTSIYYDA